jgi:hypothetical protein
MTRQACFEFPTGTFGAQKDDQFVLVMLKDLTGLAFMTM